MRRSKNNRRKAARQAPRLPRLPRVKLRTMLLAPVLLAVLAATFAATQMLLDRPVRTLVVEGTFQRVTPIQVEASLAQELERGFLSTDIATMRRQVEALEWVENAEIRRAWPDTLLIRVTEHRAAARWGERGLLNIRGELFTEDARHAFPELPHLAGPPGSEREVARRYLSVRGRLAEANLMLRSLAVDERGAWRLVLDGGQEIRLGQRDVAGRLERFFQVAAPALAESMTRVSYVDLRYTNGFAVGWFPGTGIPRLAQTQGVGDSG